MKKFLISLLILPLLTVSAGAEPVYADALPEVQAVEDALPESEREVSGELSLDGGYDTTGALQRLFQRFITKAKEQLREELNYVAGLISIALICAVAAALCAEGSLKDYISIAGCCAAAVMLAGRLDGVIADAVSAINRLSDYSKAAMPAIFTAAAACGAVTSASAKYAAVCLAMDVIMSAAQRLIIPLIYAYIAISISSSIFPNPILKTAARLSKWCATTAMTVLTLAFSAYISLTSLVTGSADAVAVKTAKTVISNSLPVVGGIVSDAASVVLSAASVIKNSAGVFSLVAVCALCAAPFAALSVKMLLFKATAAAADMIEGGRLSALINDMGTALGMLLGLVGCCGIMLFISIMSGIKVVTI